MGDDPTLEEGVLDPRVVEWFEANPIAANGFEDFSPEMLALARGPVGAPPTRELDQVVDDEVDGIRIRTYRNNAPPTGLVVYFHGGGHCIGSIGLMDNMARELAHGAGAAVVSVEYRLAPEHPFPAGLDDCEAVTRWALANTARFDVPATRVAVGGESAGGNLAAAVSLRLRGNAEVPLAAQVLMYPGVDANSMEHRSKEEFLGIVLTRKQKDFFWASYSGGRDLARDQFATPLQAPSLADLPPAFLALGGCDPLRDEGRAYAARLREAGVPVAEVCYPGQPHGFLNFGVPAADDAFRDINGWLRTLFAEME
jgi:acetyl esterase